MKTADITRHPAYLWGLLILAALGEGIVEAIAQFLEVL